MLENAVYSVISPEGCAAILYKDAKRAADAAEALKITAEDSLKNGIIEEIISEKNIGEPEFYNTLKNKLANEIKGLLALSKEDLTNKRYERFRAIGRF